jgi:hypothetical protein
MLNNFKEQVNVGDNKIITVKSYAKDDENPNIENLINFLNTSGKNVFITEIVSQLKIYGNDAVVDFLNNILHSSFDCKVVVLCYQCRRNLENLDPRLSDFIYNVDSVDSQIPNVCFVEERMFVPKNISCIEGIDKLGYSIECCNTDKIYIKTEKRKEQYKDSIYRIYENRNPFNVLKDIDNETNKLFEDCGSYEEWLYALDHIKQDGSWYKFIKKSFGMCKGIGNFIGNWINNDLVHEEKKQWLYFIALKLYGSENWCLNKAICKSKNKGELIKNIYRSLLDENLEVINEEYWDKYDSRKKIIATIGNKIKECISFCNIAKSKGDKFIYLITDGTDIEKKLIFEYLDKYANQTNRNEITEIIKKIFPDLYYYLSSYYIFDNKLLNKYFQDYKYQKVINKIFPEFKMLVEEQAVKRDFNCLPARASKIDEINKENTALCFVDALGVEFLSFLLHKCQEHNLISNVEICRCELPSLTKYNKEFLEEFEKNNCNMIGGKRGIKDLDDIKHEGINGFDYEKTRLPIHLLEELKNLDKVITTIDNDIAQGKYSKAIIVSDHGATRLAVINENENNWSMNSKGEHSGRCCPVNEIDTKLDFAIEENKYWVLANYDRFKGGRKSDVEVHGGASLEEVIVPIIEITREENNIEFVMKTKVVKFNVRKKNAIIAFFASYKIYDVSVAINGYRYKTNTSDDQNFKVNLTDLKKAGMYKVKIYSKNNLLNDKLTFKAEKEGMTTRKLF